MYVLFRKHFVLRLTLIFASVNTTIPIKYALSRFTKKLFKDAAHQRQSYAILRF